MEYLQQVELPAFVIKVAGQTGNAFKKLDVGLSRAKVLEILGRPDGVERTGSSEVLTYRNRLMSGWGWDRADYYVVLNDEKVSSYGTGTVREKEPPTIVIPPQFQSPDPRSSRNTQTCVATRNLVSGLYRNCIYRCTGGEVALTIGGAEICPLTIER